MTETSKRDPRLKQCSKCDNWVGMSNIVGSCADCMNSKGFGVSCNCGVPGCAACWDGEEVAKVLEEEEIKGLDDTTEHDREMARVDPSKFDFLATKIDAPTDSVTRHKHTSPETITRYGWWVSFLLMNRKDYTPILGNVICFADFSEIVEVDALNFLSGAAYAKSGESPQTHTATILNYKRMEGMDFEMKDFEGKQNVLHVASGRETAEKENVVNMFGKDKS